MSDDPAASGAPEGREANGPVEADGAVSVDEPVEPVEPSAPTDYAQFRVLHLESVLYDLGDASPAVHLQEAESPYRYLQVPVALIDAQAIHAAHVQDTGRRPTTHELLASVLARSRVDLIAARITRYEAGVFYAEIDLMTPHGREVVDCRTSDALALALRREVPAPILCAEEVLVAYYT